MLTRHILLVLAAPCLVACQRLSPAERSVIGTWRVQEIDGAEYMILGADHSYAFVAGADHDFPRNMLISEGTWRIEGNELIIDTTTAYPADSQKARRGPERHIDREPVAEFFKGRHKHAPITYDRLKSI